MAGRNIGPTIGLGGEAEFRNQIKNINAEMGVLQAQLEKTAVSFEGNEKSEEALSEKTKILTQMNEQLEKAVEATKKQHDEVAEKYGENSTAALKLEKDLVKYEKQIIQNNNAIDKNIEALNDNGKALDENGRDLQENSEKVSFWAQDVQNEFNTVKDMVNSALGAIKAGLTSLNDMVSESAQKAGEITSSAEKAGMSAQSYQELSYAAQQLKLDVDMLTDSMKDLSEKAFDAAQDPASETARMFNQINVSVTDYTGNLKDSQTIWEETMRALGNVANETERNAIAAKLLGGASTQLAQVMSSEGISTLQRYAQEASNIGAVLDGGTLRALEDLNKTQMESQATIEGVKNRIAGELAPSFAEASEAATQLLLAFEPLITDALGWALNHVPEIAQGFMVFVGALIALKIVTTLTPLINLMNTSLMSTNATLAVTNATLMTNPVVLIVTGVVGAVAGLVAGIALFNDKTDEISDGMDDMARGMESVGESANKLEKGMEEVANSIDWEAINLDFEAKFAILGSNSAAAFKRNLLEGFNGFENQLSQKLSGMQLKLSPSQTGTANVPVIQGQQTVQQIINLEVFLDKYKVAEIIYDPIIGVAKQKGMA